MDTARWVPAGNPINEEADDAGSARGTVAATSGWRTSPTRSSRKPNDAIIRITSSGLCGSDLHLYETLGPFMGEGDVLGHEPMGIVEEVGPAVGDLRSVTAS